MTIETRSVKKKTTMGKSTADLPVQGLGQDLHPAKNSIIVAPPEATSATRRENEIYLGGQPHNSAVPNQTTCMFVEGIVEDCDDDGGEGSDPPTRLFLWRRLDNSIDRSSSRLVKR